MKTLSMQMEESMLTGESKVAGKHPDVIATETKGGEEIDVALAERSNLLFSGTLVAKGKGIGVVFGTGMDTEMGAIQAGLQDAAESKETTPLQKKIKEFGDQLALTISVLCALIWVINFHNFFDPIYPSPLIGALQYFKIAIALAVAAIPEGLPAVITTCLALGTRQMAKKNAIVRKLPSVETLGCTTVICSDKTGTLTTNKMTVQRFCLFAKNGSILQSGMV